MSKIEDTLLEALSRYNQINKYAKKMIMEQDAPVEDPTAPPVDDPTADPAAGGDVPADPAGGGEVAPDAPIDDMPAEEPAPADTGTEGDMGDTEEIDITDLVNMTKSIKKDMEEKGDASDAVLGKMDDVFKKIDDLESRLGEMDSIMDKIDQLGYKIEKVKEPTPEEKLQLRSLDSYPFNKTTDEFFDEKMPEMEKTHKNEYVITPDDVEDYSKDDIKNTFNTDDEEEDEFKNKL